MSEPRIYAPPRREPERLLAWVVAIVMLVSIAGIVLWIRSG